MNDFLRTAFPLLGMFLGILAITRAYFFKLEKKILEIEKEVKELNKELKNQEKKDYL